MLFHSHRTGKNVKDRQCRVSENGEQRELASTSGEDAGVWNDAATSKIRQRLPWWEMDLPPPRAAGDMRRRLVASCSVDAQPLKNRYM